MPIESDWPLQVAKMTRKNGDSTIKSGEEHLKEPIFHRLSKHLLSLCYIYILSDSILRQRANVGSSTRWSKLTQPFQRLACLWWHQPRSLWPRSRWFHYPINGKDTKNDTTSAPNWSHHKKQYNCINKRPSFRIRHQWKCATIVWPVTCRFQVASWGLDVFASNI
jgi:hypothetical protein